MLAFARCGASARARLMCCVLKQERYPHKCGRRSLRSSGDRSPQTEARSPGYEGKSVSDRIFFPPSRNIHWIKLTAKTKLTGRGRRPAAPGTRWLCSRAVRLLLWHALQPRAVSRHQHLKRADATSLWREKQVKNRRVIANCVSPQRLMCNNYTASNVI